jgi:hypothetical protein
MEACSYLPQDGCFVAVPAGDRMSPAYSVNAGTPERAAIEGGALFAKVCHTGYDLGHEHHEHLPA